MYSLWEPVGPVCTPYIVCVDSDTPHLFWKLAVTLGARGTGTDIQAQGATSKVHTIHILLMKIYSRNGRGPNAIRLNLNYWLMLIMSQNASICARIFTSTLKSPMLTGTQQTNTGR